MATTAYPKPPSPPVAPPQAPGDPDNLKKIVEHLRSDESVKAVADAIKGSGSKRKPEAIEAQARDFLNDGIRQVSDQATDAHADLAQSTAPSVLNSIVKLAAWGIPPNHITSEGWLIPRFNKTLRAMVCGAVPGVRGLERVLMHNGASHVKSSSIRRQDHFVCVEGTDERLEFTRNLTPDKTKPNDIIGAWSVVKMKDGRQLVKTVPLIEMELSAKSARMTMESAAAYKAQRAAMRDALRTFCMDNTAVRAMVEEEEQNHQFKSTNPEEKKIEQSQSQAGPGVLGASAATGIETVAAETVVAGQGAVGTVPNSEAVANPPVEVPSAEPVIPATETPAAEVVLPIEELAQLMEAQTGSASRSPGTPIGRLSQNGFDVSLGWAIKATAANKVPESEKPFVAGILATNELLTKYGISFADAKAAVVAFQEQGAAGVRV